jgi:hypothetical protein
MLVVLLIGHVYCTTPHSLQEFQAEIEAVAEEITGDTLCDTPNQQS